MRKLITSDIFSALRVIKASGIKEGIKPILRRLSDEADLEDVGMDTVITILECLSDKKAEEAFYEFLSGPCELKADEAKNLSFEELSEAIKDIAKENDLKSFFTSLLAVITKN